MKPGLTLRKRIGLLLTSPLSYKAKLLDELIKMPGLLVLVTNARFEMIMANDYFYTYFDCASADLAGKALYTFFNDDQYNDINSTHINRILVEGHVWDYDARTTGADGEVVLIRWNHGVFYDGSEHPNILSVGVVQTAYGEKERAYDNGIASPGTDDVYAGVYTADPGGDGYSAFDVKNAVITEEDIRLALERRDIVLFYQPTVNARTKKITGAEALVRFNHPRYGILPPGTFIPVAEQTGQIIEIGEYVIGTACKNIKRWADMGLDYFLSINISTQQFMHESFAETLLQAITRHDVTAGRLMLEITEDTASRDPHKVQGVIQTLRGMGCQISLDDFGTGFSSFHFLEKLDIDNIKIDRAFLSNASLNRKSFAIVESIIVLAHGLGMSVTAEGVETQEQLSFLTDNACDYLQGYLISHPLPVVDFDRLVNENPGFFNRGR